MAWHYYKDPTKGFPCIPAIRPFERWNVADLALECRDRKDLTVFVFLSGIGRMTSSNDRDLPGKGEKTPATATPSPRSQIEAAIREWGRQLELAFHRDDPHAGEKSEEIKKLRVIQRLYEVLVLGNHDHWAEVCHNDFFLDIVGPKIVPFVGKWTGLGEVIDAVRRNLAFLEQQHVEINTVIAQGDKLIVIAFEQGIYRMTGKPYATHFFHCFFFRDGKLAGCREFIDGLRLAESMSLPAKPPALADVVQFIPDPPVV